MRTKVPEASDHNHPINSELFCRHPEIRKLTADEEQQAVDMLNLGTASGVMSQALNAKRTVEGKLRVPTAKEVANRIARARAKKREGLTEEAFVGKIPKDVEIGNSGTC